MPNDFQFDDAPARRSSRDDYEDDDRPRRRRRSRDDDDYDDEPRSRYRCRFCGSRMAPVYISKVSTLGWIVFIFGLLFFLIGCLLGLLFKENVRVCPECNHRL